MLEHCPLVQATPVLDHVRTQLFSLCKEQYGNYVVQHVVEHGRPEDRQKVLALVSTRPTSRATSTARTWSSVASSWRIRRNASSSFGGWSGRRRSCRCSCTTASPTTCCSAFSTSRPRPSGARYTRCFGSTRRRCSA